MFFWARGRSASYALANPEYKTGRRAMVLRLIACAAMLLAPLLVWFLTFKKAPA